jgi:hypothetical protein
MLISQISVGGNCPPYHDVAVTLKLSLRDVVERFLDCADGIGTLHLKKV